MNLRDLEYIENRLMTPVITVGEAYARLRDTGGPDVRPLTDKLMKAMQDFTDVCREVRQEVTKQQRMKGNY